VEEIIDLWNKDLEDHVQSFTEQANEIKKWDQQHFENGDKIIKLQQNVQDVQLSQQRLNRIIETIKTNQQDLFQVITELEKGVEKAGKKNLNPDEIKREQAYKMAEDIENQLMQMSDSLNETIRKLNQTTERNLDPANPLTKIIKILNVQMTSLNWIENASLDLDAKLQKTNSLIRKAKQKN